MNLKDRVRDYWDNNICGVQEHSPRNPQQSKPVSDSTPYTRKYFEDIESRRYFINPEIFGFTQFTRYHGKKVLEVGVGPGTDFVQWCKAGAEACGVDLTPKGIEHAQRWLDEYQLKGKLSIMDAEYLEFPDDTFDLVYSWGVLHHTPDTQRAIQECIRVCKLGGEIKLMLYNRKSLTALGIWLSSLIHDRRFRTLSGALANNMESPGTKAFTKNEVVKMLKPLPVEVIEIKAGTNKYDLLYQFPLPVRVAAYIFNWLTGFNSGFFMTIWLRKYYKRG